MREVKVLTWCDMCWDDDMMQTPAEHSFTIGVVLGESRPALKLLELCELHAKTIVELQELLQGVGTLPEFGKRTATKTPEIAPPPAKVHSTKACPVCHMQVKTNVMVAHVWREHRTDEKPPVPKICPECREQIDTPVGMAQHRRGAHQHDALAEALAGVKGYKG